MEPIFELKKTVENQYLGSDGCASAWALLRFAMDAAAAHSKYISADRETLTKMGLFWVVIRHRMEISRYPTEGETVTVKTWPMPTTRSAYPRAVIGYDEQGKQVFRLTSLWVLVDIQRRKMVLPGKTGITVEGFTLGNELELPAKILPRELQHTTLRRVTEDDIDINQHMNNAKYLSWAMDLVPTMPHPKGFDICYITESRLDQQLKLNWTLSEEGVLQVEGSREETDVPGQTTRIFAANVYF